MTDDEENEVAFESAVFQLATNASMEQAFTKVFITEEATMAPARRVVTNQTQKNVSEAAQQAFAIFSLSSPFFPVGPSSFVDALDAGSRRNPRGKKKEKVLSWSSPIDRGIRLMKPSINRRHEWPGWTEEDSMPAPKLAPIHLVNVAFAEAVTYRTYGLFICSHTSSKKVAVWTARLAKRIKTPKKSYKLEDSSPDTKLYF